MNFLAPLFLLGALAIAAPILFHLIRRTTREKTRFSSLLFLQPDPPRLTQRSRIENWLLLLLRAGALALLALAFARPFIRTESPTETDPDNLRRRIILVDTSASMQRAGLMTAALEKANEILRAAKPADQVALWTFDSTTRRLMDFAEWSTLEAANRATTAAGRLTDLKAGWSSTQLANALTSAAEVLAEVPPGQELPSGGEIVLISDLQEGSRVEGLQGWSWPQDVFVTPVVLTPENPDNAGLALAPEIQTPDPAAPPAVRVRVWNSAGHANTQFQAGWAAPGSEAFTAGAQDVTVPAGQSRVVVFPWTPGSPSGLRLLLKGDQETFDNSIYAAPPVALEVTAHYFGPEALTDSKKPLFFLNQALPQTRQVTVKLNPVPPSASLPVVESGQAVSFFANGSLPPEQAAFLHTQLTSGRTVFYSLTSQDAGAALGTLAGTGPVSLTEAKPANYGMWSETDFKHPLFAPFADSRYSDFTKIRFWSWRKFEAAALPGSRVLAKFDSGDPALVEVPVGAGRLLILATGWEPASSQLALSTKFVPLLASLLEWSGSIITPPAQFFPGQAVPLVQLGLSGAGPVTVRSPEGISSTLSPEIAAYTATNTPGLYTASAGTLTKTFAVNPEPAESRIMPMATDELDRLGVPLVSTAQAAGNAARRSPGPAVETESRQKLWRWIIAAALAVLLMETLLAGLAARRSLAPGGSAV